MLGKGPFLFAACGYSIFPAPYIKKKITPPLAPYWTSLLKTSWPLYWRLISGLSFLFPCSIFVLWVSLALLPLSLSIDILYFKLRSTIFLYRPTWEHYAWPSVVWVVCPLFVWDTIFSRFYIVLKSFPTPGSACTVVITGKPGRCGRGPNRPQSG